MCMATVVDRSLTSARFPGRWKVRVWYVPSARPTLKHTVPTGFSSLPPPGPAMPVMPTAMSAPNRRSAPAAMAIAAVLPRHEKSERDLVFTVLAVTVLSTVAMVIYPMLAQVFGLDARDAGVFLGGTIHDVAQVVGAGFSISPEAGETATLVKLIRVSMLAPVVLVFSLAIRARGLADQVEGQRPPLLPGFVLGFLILAAVNSAGLIPVWLADAAGALSRWALLVAIAAVGIKTELGRMLEVGAGAMVLLLAETVFLGAFVVTGLHWLQ